MLSWKKDTISKRIIYVVLFLIGSFLLLIGTGIILSQDKTPAGIINFIYHYYGMYTYAILALAASQTISIFVNKEKSTLWSTICQMTVYIASFVLAFGFYYIQYSEEGPDAKIIIGYIVTIIAALIATLLICKVFLYKQKFLHPFQEKNYELIFFSFFLIRFILNYPGSINQWTTIWYAMDYNTAGFGSRLLMGSILHVLLGGRFVSKEVIYLYAILCLLAIIVLTSCLLGKFIRKYTPTHKEAAWFFTLCYLVSPFSIEQFWTGEMGRLESFLVLFLLLFVIGFHKIKNIHAKYLLACIVSVICIACYQGYVFMYFPVLFTVIVLEIESNKANRKSCIIWNSIVCLVNVIVSMIFQFKTNLRYQSSDELFAKLEAHTDIDMTVGTLDCEYFMDIRKRWETFTYQFIFLSNEHPREKMLLLTLILFPLIILFICLWKKIYDSEIHRAVFWILLSDLAILPMFILNMDWGRWLAAFGCVQFFQIFYLIYTQPAGAQKAMDSLTAFVKKHGLLCILFLIYLMPLGKIHGFKFPAEVDTLMDIIRMISRRTFQFIWK